MKIFIYILGILLLPFAAIAQNPNGSYNPYVNSGTVSPSPIWPVEAGGEGSLVFNFGNSGSDPLSVFDDQYITLTLTISYGKPAGIDPVAAVGGTAAEYFNWSYNGDTYSAVQIAEVPAGFSGSIEIAYLVTKNSASPGLNGFNVNISPAPYQTESNTQDDDAVSSYTYTEILDYGDAPDIYGVAWHTIDFTNYLGDAVDGEYSNQSSLSADGDDLSAEDDEDGVSFPEEMYLGDTVELAVTVSGIGYLSGWVDWNNDKDFDDINERIANNLPRFSGTEMLEVKIPGDAVFNAALACRFRISNQTIDNPTGKVIGGEVEDYMISLLSSVTAPDIPGNLSVDDLSEDYVTISWTASQDDGTVEGYNVFRDGNNIATTTDLSYTDSTIIIGNRYIYTVSAYDNDGYESGLASPVIVDVVDDVAPSVPQGLAITTLSDTSVQLSWQASSDNVGIQEYRVYRDYVLMATTSGLASTDSAVIGSMTYTYTVTAVDAAGNESAHSEEVYYHQIDELPPSVPSGLYADSASKSGLRLLWNSSSDNVGVEGYHVYRSGELISTVNDTTVTDENALGGETYTYTVTAFDEAGNESNESEPLIITVSAVPYMVVSELKIVPNPSSGAFKLEINESKGKFTFELLSSQGTVIAKQAFNKQDLPGELYFSFPNLDTGLYAIRLYNSRHMYYGKILIVR